MKPSIGRIVHFVQQDGVHLPAMVISVAKDTAVNLLVFLDQRTYPPGFVANYTERHESVHYDEASKLPATWHWPEREE